MDLVISIAQIVRPIPHLTVLPPQGLRALIGPRQREMQANYDSVAVSEEAEDEAGGVMKEYGKSVIFGSTDGVCFSMVVVSASVGCGLEWEVILTLAVSALAANCVVVGGGEFFSSRAHRTFMQAASRREQWNYKRNRKSQIDRLSLRYQTRGMNRSDADLLSNKMSTNEKFFISQLVSEDIGLQLPDDNDTTVLLDVMVMLISYFMCGFLPVLVFLLPYFSHEKEIHTEEMYVIFLVVGSALTLILGAVKSTFSQAHWSSTALEAVGVASPHRLSPSP